MKVAEFLRTIGCVNRDTLRVSITEEMRVKASTTLREYLKDPYFRKFDDLSVTMITPSTSAGDSLAVLVAVKPIPAEA